MLSRASLIFDEPQSRPLARRLHFQPQDGYARYQLDLRSVGRNSPPKRSVYEQQKPNRDFALLLRTLHRHYTILDSEALMETFLDQGSGLYDLLIEAVEPLHSAFGERRIFHIRVQISDDGNLIKVGVQLPPDFGDDAERALHSFDSAWWLDNCHRSAGCVVFDYEIQDVV